MGHIRKLPRISSFPFPPNSVQVTLRDFLAFYDLLYWHSGSNNAVECHHVLPLPVVQNSIFIRNSRPGVSSISFPINPKCLLLANWVHGLGMQLT